LGNILNGQFQVGLYGFPAYAELICDLVIGEFLVAVQQVHFFAAGRQLVDGLINEA
jgi:hypothetical protein